ncbi:MAG: TlpA family protein disulfide reductase [Rhodospirillales bacterium]|nr:TlpA family protein disulfide reductase [Rhodospirillales bacterium]
MRPRLPIALASLFVLVAVLGGSRLYPAAFAVEGAEAFALPAFSLDEPRKAHLADLPALTNALDRDLLEDRAVLVNFFASWCPPCRAEFPTLVELDAKYRGAGLTIVSVNLFEEWGGGSDGPRLKQFLDGHAPQFPVLLGAEETKALFGGVTRVPTVMIFEHSGAPVLRFVHLNGAEKTHLSEAELEAAIRTALRLD